MAKDPNCGMEVYETDTLAADRGGVTFYFCSEHCRQKFLASDDPATATADHECCHSDKSTSPTTETTPATPGTVLSRAGPRIALAVSKDLFHWSRLGLATFEPYRGIDFVHVDNKDVSLFPIAIPNHRGKMQLAMIHRPLFAGSRPEETNCEECSRLVDLDHESIWISYCPMAFEGLEPTRLALFNSHHRLATPIAPWEALKIGGGTPPVMTRYGWMILYHGVHATGAVGGTGKHLCDSAGVMILSKEHPRTLLYRSPAPLLSPTLSHERDGVVDNVVFPTGIDCRNDIGQPDRFDIYYGMADSRIGVASMTVPQRLPMAPSPRVDAPNAVVPVVPQSAEATT